MHARPRPMRSWLQQAQFTQKQSPEWYGRASSHILQCVHAIDIPCIVVAWLLALHGADGIML